MYVTPFSFILMMIVAGYFGWQSHAFFVAVKPKKTKPLEFPTDNDFRVTDIESVAIESLTSDRHLRSFLADRD